MPKIMSNSKEQLNDKAQRFFEASSTVQEPIVAYRHDYAKEAQMNPKNILLWHHAIMTKWMCYVCSYIYLIFSCMLLIKTRIFGKKSLTHIFSASNFLLFIYNSLFYCNLDCIITEFCNNHSFWYSAGCGTVHDRRWADKLAISCIELNHLD